MTNRMILKELPSSLKTEKDLDSIFNIFYSEKVQASNYKYLRFGQFIFNQYNIEVKNSYNESDPYLAYGLIYNYLLDSEKGS